jgi:hypothetical protein
MRKTVMLFVLIISCYVSYAQKQKIIYPEAAFDSLEAKKALDLGGVTIQGRAFTKSIKGPTIQALSSQKVYAANAVVVLLPVTPYFEAWHALRKKKEGKKYVVYMSDEAYAWRVETKTDDDGRFTFKKMKPGKYFLQVFINYSTSYTSSVYAGSGYNSYGRTDFYTPQNYSIDHHDRVEKYVDIKQDSGVVKVKLH